MARSRIAIKQQKKSDKQKKIGTIVSLIALILIGLAIYCIANFDHIQGNVANYRAILLTLDIARFFDILPPKFF